MPLFESPAFEGHEGVHAFYDEASGLRAIVAVHSTVRGPAAGGVRMWAYENDQAALDDALKLSRAMSYKNAVADLELGGGKSVIIGDARTQKTPALFEAFGEAVESLGGRYWAAEDVGVSPADLTHTRRRTRFVAGLEGHDAASGDPSPVTAEGVFRGVRLCVRRALGCELDGVRVAIQGVGNVGGGLADKLAAAGAVLTVTDANLALAEQVADRTGAELVAPGAIFDAEADVFAPCALGGAVSIETLARIKARIVAGGANNQLASPEAGQALYEKGLIYAPDYVINGGGIINVAAEIRALELGLAYDRAWVDAKLARLTDTLDEILQRSLDERRPTHLIAAQVARARLTRAGAKAAA